MILFHLQVGLVKCVFQISTFLGGTKATLSSAAGESYPITVSKGFGIWDPTPGLWTKPSKSSAESQGPLRGLQKTLRVTTEHGFSILIIIYVSIGHYTAQAHVLLLASQSLALHQITV